MLLHLPHWSIQTRNRFLIFGVWVIKYYDVQFPFELFVLVFVICMEASIRTSKYTERNMQFRLSVCRYVCVFFRSRSLSFSLIFPKFTAFGTQSMAGRKYRNVFQIDPNSRLYAYTISHRHTTCKTLFIWYEENGVSGNRPASFKNSSELHCKNAHYIDVISGLKLFPTTYKYENQPNA